MAFENITYLYLLGLIPLFILFFVLRLLWRKRALKRLGDPNLTGQLMGRYSTRRKIIKLSLLLLAFAFLVMGLANLRLGSKKEKVQNEGSEVMILFDVSKSMDAQDVKPDRLTMAKVTTSQMIEKLAGNKIGLIVFAGKAYLQMPLSVDARAALMYLNTFSTDMVPTQGTAIGTAIELAIKEFDNGGEQVTSQNNDRAIIIITDGETHDQDALDEAQKAANDGIKIITIGVGTAEGAPIPEKNGGQSSDFKHDENGNIVLSKLDEQMLQQLASAGGGTYLNINEGKRVISTVNDEIAKLNKEKGDSYQFTEYANHFQLFLGVGLFLLTIEFFMSDKRPLWLQRFTIFENKKSNGNEK